MQHHPRSSQPTPRGDLSTLTFHDRFVSSVPGDLSVENRPRKVLEACYSLVRPTPLADPELVAWSDDLAHTLGLEKPKSTKALPAIEILSGNRLTASMRPFAACYGGHQFGQWAGQLGDGRVITLGEVEDPTGRLWELQLKGSGPTPYSRRGDGRAVLRSSIREFLCSEAMHHLGIPTTRALSLVRSSDVVLRDMLYDGHPEAETCAVVTRVAPSFLRFGNYEILASRQDLQNLERLARHTVTAHFSEIDAQSPRFFDDWFLAVCRRTATLVAHWMRVGFVHGVLNTDNMSVLGLTIDYGPYGWLDAYDPYWTPNTTDLPGRRYAFANQPAVALWNLTQFGFSLSSLFRSPATLEQGRDAFAEEFGKQSLAMMASKLGLPSLDDEQDAPLVVDLATVLQLSEIDMTIFYRRLANVTPAFANASADVLLDLVADAYYDLDGVSDAQKSITAEWLRGYMERTEREGLSPESRRRLMNTHNPKFVFRNYLAQEAIEAAERGDTTRIETLLAVLQRPYDEQPEHEILASRRPDWARDRQGCSALSCSS